MAAPEPGMAGGVFASPYATFIRMRCCRGPRRAGTAKTGAKHDAEHLQTAIADQDKTPAIARMAL